MLVKPYFKGVFCAKMAITQWNESANHMFKTYMPPASPMHIFVRQYVRLQFDRERRKATKRRGQMFGGGVRRTNLAIEWYMSKIYTGAMFKQFGRLLIEARCTMLQRLKGRGSMSVLTTMLLRERNRAELSTR